MEYDPYQEKKKERRIRDQKRVWRKAYRYFKYQWFGTNSGWTSSEIEKESKKWSSRLCNNMTKCSCFFCGHQRKWHGDTLQEKRSKASFEEQKKENT